MEAKYYTFHEDGKELHFVGKLIGGKLVKMYSITKETMSMPADDVLSSYEQAERMQETLVALSEV